MSGQQDTKPELPVELDDEKREAARRWLARRIAERAVEIYRERAGSRD